MRCWASLHSGADAFLRLFELLLPWDAWIAAGADAHLRLIWLRGNTEHGKSSENRLSCAADVDLDELWTEVARLITVAE